VDQDSQTAAIAALSALAGGTLGGLFSGFYQHMRDLWNKPKLEIDLDDSDSGIVQAEWEEGGQLIQRVLVRPYVINNGKRTAVNCRVYIIAISEVLESKVTPTKYKDSMQIPWPGWQFTPKDIPQGIRSYVDLIRVRKDHAGWDFALERRPTVIETLKAYTGTYRFHLVAVADNAEAAYRDINVHYVNDWHNLRAFKDPADPGRRGASARAR
jgi:hypothetical protein